MPVSLNQVKEFSVKNRRLVVNKIKNLEYVLNKHTLLSRGRVGEHLTQEITTFSLKSSLLNYAHFEQFSFSIKRFTTT